MVTVWRWPGKLMEQEGTVMGERLIAVVDDHPLIAKALGELLAYKGYKTLDFFQFSSFRDWLDKKQALDLCIIDYSLPDIEGNQIVPSLKACREDLPVAIWSGREDEGLSQAVLEQGAIGFISKAIPITTIPPAIDLMLAGEIFVSSRGRSLLLSAAGVRGRRVKRSLALPRVSSR